MSNYIVDGSDLTSIANAIRARGGTSASLAFPSGFVSAIGAIPGGATPTGTLSITSNGIYDVASFASADVNVSGGGGSSDDMTAMVRRAISAYSNSEIDVIGIYAFACCYYLSEVNCENAIQVGTSAFAGCSSLSSINFPNCIYIGQYAFQGCKLISASFPKATAINSYAFQNNRSLASCYFPKVTEVQNYAFAACSQLSSIDLPKAKSIGATVFQSCSHLENISVPEVESVGTGAFNACSSLKTIYMPKVKVFYTSVFTNCCGLSSARFDAVSKISGSYAFRYCYNLLSLYLLGSSLCTLSATNAFQSTPISTYTTSTGGVRGSIFVRASLYSSYISATNWTYFSARFVSLTDAQIAALDGGT